MTTDNFQKIFKKKFVIYFPIYLLISILQKSILVEISKIIQNMMLSLSFILSIIIKIGIHLSNYHKSGYMVENTCNNNKLYINVIIHVIIIIFPRNLTENEMWIRCVSSDFKRMVKQEEAQYKSDPCCFLLFSQFHLINQLYIYFLQQWWMKTIHLYLNT